MKMFFQDSLATAAEQIKRLQTLVRSREIQDPGTCKEHAEEPGMRAVHAIVCTRLSEESRQVTDDEEEDTKA